MLNAMKKTALIALTSMTLIGSLSAAANANTAALVKTNAPIVTQQARFENNTLNLHDAKIVNAGFKHKTFSTHRGFNSRGFNSRGFNTFGLKSSGSSYDKFGYDKYGYNRLGYNKLGFDKFGNSRASNRAFGTRNFTRSKGFTNHTDAGSTFKNTKLFKGRF